MKLENYEKISIGSFKGLYRRGTEETVPKDHAIDLKNVTFNKGDVRTRPGIAVSFAFPSERIKSFIATFNDNAVHLLTLDIAGNIYEDDNGTVLLNVPGMIDFEAINLFNKCFILPVLGPGAASSRMYIWDGTLAPRPALGFAPSGPIPLLAVDGPAGDIDAGLHKIAVVYETDSGFITKPGITILGVFTPALYNAPGGTMVDVSQVPIGPIGTVKRHIIITKADEEEYFFVAGGTIENNLDTSITVNFFDDDLILSADYLFDEEEEILAPTAAGDLGDFDGRLIVVSVGGDLIQYSKSGEPEAFDRVTGQKQLPTQRDGNVARATFVHRNNLYFSKAVGLFQQPVDPQTEPSGWPIAESIDGSVGCYANGIATITGSEGNLAMFDFILIADPRGGLYLFDGVPRRPPVSWKIDDLWKDISIGRSNELKVVLDPFYAIAYVLLPIGGSSSTLLIADLSDGFDAENVRWSIWEFPFTVKTINIGNFQDQDGFADYNYYFRIFGDNKVFKLKFATLTDNGTSIESYYQFALSSVMEGYINVYTAVRFDVLRRGSNLTQLDLNITDFQGTLDPPSLPLVVGNRRDLLRQINFMSESIAVKCGTTASGGFILARIDIFGKPLFTTRPGEAPSSLPVPFTNTLVYNLIDEVTEVIHPDVVLGEFLVVYLIHDATGDARFILWDEFFRFASTTIDSTTASSTNIFIFVGKTDVDGTDKWFLCEIPRLGVL